MIKRHGLRIVEKLVNLTNKEIKLYSEHTGDIIKIPPISKSPQNQSNTCEQPDEVYYILNKKALNGLKGTDYPLDYIVIDRGKSIGRNNTEITNLFWGKDESIRIGLY